MARFLTWWLVFWIWLFILNLPVRHEYDMSIRAYISLSGSFALLLALIADTMQTIYKQIRK